MATKPVITITNLIEDFANHALTVYWNISDPDNIGLFQGAILSTSPEEGSSSDYNGLSASSTSIRSHTFTGLTVGTTYYLTIIYETNNVNTTAVKSMTINYIMPHPTVTSGTPITKVQMDNLKTYLGKGNTVAQYSQINASDGNTYKSGLTAGTTQITADWYNNA